MLRRTLSIITISVVVALVGVLGLSLVTAQSDPSPSATRSFSPAMVVVPGGAVTVTIEASNYGRAGGVTETLPAGFTYVSSSLPDSQVLHTGQTVRFTLQGDDSFTYTVTASEMPGPHSFSGVLRETTGDVPANLPVGGVSTVTVQSGAPMSTPTATQRPVGGGASASRSFDMANVGTGDPIMVTIAASNYGRAGGVTETLPDGFMYVSSSLPDSQVLHTGQTVRFTLQGDDSFTYTVTASEMAGPHSFSGVLRETTGDVPKNLPVGGDSMVTVGPYATRSFNTDSVRQGGRVTVTIMASNYGRAGGVTETLPAGFTYVSSSLPDSQVLHTGQTVRFTLQGDDSFTYTVTASRTTGAHTFSGILRETTGDEPKNQPVGGDASVTVRRASTGGGSTGGGGSGGGSGGGGATGGESTPAPAVPAANPPIIAGGTREEFSVPENMTAVTSLSVVDGRTVTWKISGGFDAAEFSIGAESGELMFKTAPDFETPTDEGANNVYVVVVGATDSDTLSDTLLVLVTVTDVVDESTATPTPEPTATLAPTATPTPVATATPEPTATPTPAATAMPEPTATSAPVATATSMPEPTATSMPAATATSMPAVITATSMPEPTATSMPEPTATSMPAPTAVAPEEPGGGFPILVVVLIVLVAVVVGAGLYIRSRR